MNNEQKVIAMLERIVAGDLTGIDTGLGLCVQASSVQLWAGYRSYNFINIQKHFSSWEHYSGREGDQGEKIMNSRYWMYVFRVIMFTIFCGCAIVSLSTMIDASAIQGERNGAGLGFVLAIMGIIWVVGVNPDKDNE